ncbi:MAG: ribbon-helix-helix protein, CopG family [Rhodoglobus sp.]
MWAAISHPEGERISLATYPHIMQRTQISVTAAERRALDAEAARTGRPMSALVRDAIGQLGRDWLPSHSSVDSADLAIAATALMLDAELLTGNVHHPMFAGLTQPY